MKLVHVRNDLEIFYMNIIHQWIALQDTSDTTVLDDRSNLTRLNDMYMIRTHTIEDFKFYRANV